MTTLKFPPIPSTAFFLSRGMLLATLMLAASPFAIRATGGEVTSGDTASGSAAPKTDREIYAELEKTFYVGKDVEKSKAKTVETRSKQIESKAEGYLASDGSSSDTDIKTWARKYIPEILALSENYRVAAREARFPEQSLTFKVQLMCEGFAETYRALAKENLATARSSMKRATEKRREIRDSIFAQ